MPIVGRILISLALVAAGMVAARTVADGLRDSARQADPYRYRPRGRRGSRNGAPGPDSDPAKHRSVLRRSALGQLRDGLSGAPLSADDELFRCADCQSFYTAASVRALATENGARCLHCGSMHRLTVDVVD